MKIRDREVLLPTTIVGAYPRPLFMQGTKVFTWGADAPEFPSYWMREQFYDAVALATKDQLDAGLDIVSDGQQHYETETSYEFSELHHYVPSRLQGYLAYGDPIAGNDGPTPVYMPTVRGPSAGSGRSRSPSPRRYARPRPDRSNIISGGARSPCPICRPITITMIRKRWPWTWRRR